MAHPYRSQIVAFQAVLECGTDMVCSTCGARLIPEHDRVRWIAAALHVGECPGARPISVGPDKVVAAPVEDVS
jgi:hypothetical protein